MTPYKETPELSGAVKALRLGLIIIPIAALLFSIVTQVVDAGLLGIDGRIGRRAIFSFLRAFMTPLSYVALGLWAAHMIRPLKAIDVVSLKKALIFFGIALPVLSAYNISTYLPDFVTRYPDDVVKWVSRAVSRFFYELSFSGFCFYAVYRLSNLNSDSGDGAADGDDEFEWKA